MALKIGKSYVCNTDGIGGYTKSTNNYNGLPLFNFSQGVFSEGTTYTVSRVVEGYRSPVASGDESMNFALMNNGWYVAAFNDWAFDLV